MANTKQISGHRLSPDGRMQPAYNRPKRFFRTLFRKILLPSLITAGIVVGAFALIPALSTAVSLTFANAALIGAGTFAATSTLIGGGTLIHEKASARRRVKKALKKNAELEAMNFIQPETVLRNNVPVYADGLNPPRHGKGFWRRRNMLYQYLKQNRNCDPSSPASNQALVQRIIDGNETNKFIDLVVLSAKRGYLGDKSRDAVKNRENKRKLKNLKNLSEDEADLLMEDVFGIENHFKTIGGYQSKTKKSRKSKTEKETVDEQPYVEEASQPAKNSLGLTPEQLSAIMQASNVQNTTPIDASAIAQTPAPEPAPVEPNSYSSEPEPRKSLVRAVLTNPTQVVAPEPKIEEKHGEIEDKSLIKSIVDEQPKPAPVVTEANKVEDSIDKKRSLLDKLNETRPTFVPETEKPRKKLGTLTGKQL